MGPPWVYAFLGALTVALIGTPLVRRLAITTGIVDRPAARKSHVKPVPYLGGVSIMAGVLTAVLFVPNLGLRAAGLIVAGLVLGAIGLLDDDHSVPAGVRFLAEGLVASQAVAFGLRVHATGIEVFDIALTVVWIVGITNALNLLDNMDGLAAGVAATAAVALFFLAILNGQVVAATLSAGLAGACGGFLVFNRRPASIFMGDAGSLFIGFVLAILTIDVNPGLAPPASFTVPVILLGLAVLDTTTVMLARTRRGQSVWQGGKDHLSHRLVALGLSPGPAVCVLVGVQALLGLVAALVGRRVVGVGTAWAAAIVVLGALAVIASRAHVYTEPVRRLPASLRLGLLGAVGVAGVMTVPAVVAMAQASGQAREGAAHVTQALSASDPGRARADLEAARTLFRQAEGHLHGRLPSLGLLVPGLASNLHSARTLAIVGAELADSGAKVAAVADASRLRVSGGSVDLKGLAHLVPVLDDAAGALARNHTRLAAADRPYVLAPLRRSIRALSEAADAGARRAALVAGSARSLPALMGMDGARRYLVVSTDASLVDWDGGLTPVGSELRAEAGRLSLIPAAGGTPARPAIDADPELPRHPAGVSSPDFPTAARALVAAYQQAQPDAAKIDGVIGTDTAGLSALAGLVGPVRVDGWADPVTSANLSEVVHAALDGEVSNENRPNLLSALSATLWQEAVTSDHDTTGRVVDALAGTAVGGHLVVYLADPVEQRLTSRLGMSGEVRPVRGDSVIAVGRSLSGDDATRIGRVTYDVHLDPGPRPARLEGELAVTLRNSVAPGDGQAGDPNLRADTRAAVSVFSPFPVVSAAVDGHAVPVRAEEDLGLLVGSAEVAVPSSETRTLRFDLAGDIDLADDGWYRLDAPPQALAGSVEGGISVSVPRGWFIAETRGLTPTGARSAVWPLTSDREPTVWVRVKQSSSGRLWDSLFGRD